MPVKGDVFWTQFKRVTPPDEAEQYDRRPVVVLHVGGANVIVGMVTTKDYEDKGAVRISPDDYSIRGSNEIHFFRPDRLATDHRGWLENHIGRLKSPKLNECVEAVHVLLKS
jgi:mRNA-degrading endonuclease toxin of MazEF toxin-antitoxin module